MSFDAYSADNIRIVSNQVTRTTASTSACGVYLDGSSAIGTAVTGNAFSGIGLATCGPQAVSIAYSP